MEPEREQWQLAGEPQQQQSEQLVLGTLQEMKECYSLIFFYMMNEDYRYNFTCAQRRLFTKDIFAAYYDCRRHKRNTVNALRFELNLEQNIRQLAIDILSETYAISRSCSFIVDWPVKREIFAADFRDRVIHHYIIAKLEPYFERIFIHDSYSCRKGKGTHFAVKRVDHFIRSCSHNYTRDCYVLKLDIQGFFMSIRKELLQAKVERVIRKYYRGFDKELLSDLCRMVVMHNPVVNCFVKGSSTDWDGLPESKSLFRTGGELGLPIGNLTSQVFANLYLNDFDHYVRRELKIKYYGRYVDDCVFVSNDKEELKELIVKVRTYLHDSLGLTVHPRKIYLQHYTKGIQVTGVFIKPHRKYIGKRIQRSMNQVFRKGYRDIFHQEEAIYQQNIKHWLCSVNSYLGISKHYDTYSFRKKLCDLLDDNPVDIGFDTECVVAKRND